MTHVEDNNLDAFHCEMCDYQTKKKAHINYKHNRFDMYDCEECEYKTHIKQNMARDKGKEHLDLKIPCPDFDYVAKSRDSMQKHYRKHYQRILDK